MRAGSARDEMPGQHEVIGTLAARGFDVRQLSAADDFAGTQQHAARVGLRRNAARGAQP